LDAGQLRQALRPPWTAIDVVAETGSTNADLLDAEPGTVLVAEHQGAGRGRLDRSWVSPAGAGLLLSAVVRPTGPASTWGWLPLLTGVVVCRAVAETCGLPAALKWPNDVLLGDQKLGGILVQASGPNAVIGIGLNVSTTQAELPVESATSLTLSGVASPDRGALLTAILAELGSQFQQWTDAAGDATASGLAAAYRARCTTIGRAVRVTTSAGERTGTATGVDADGRLRMRWDRPVQGGDAEEAIAAGDIVHLRIEASTG
jgi:BirA family transcriptional regulator, biotin operon repressor / biotin---[acetyl-CoA-carboxylase] ligase